MSTLSVAATVGSGRVSVLDVSTNALLIVGVPVVEVIALAVITNGALNDWTSTSLLPKVF
jgi:hypothetical protein